MIRQAGCTEGCRGCTRLERLESCWTRVARRQARRCCPPDIEEEARALAWEGLHRAARAWRVVQSGHFGALLRAAVRRTVVDRLRELHGKALKRNWPSVLDVTRLAPVLPARPDPEPARREAAERLAELARNCTPQEREVMALFVRHHSWTAAARAAGVTKGRMSQILRRIRDKARGANRQDAKTPRAAGSAKRD